MLSLFMFYDHDLIGSVRADAVFGRYYSVFQALAAFLKLRRALLRSFTVVNIVCSRPAFRVSSVVIRSVFTIVISIQTRSPNLSSKHHVHAV